MHDVEREDDEGENGDLGMQSEVSCERKTYGSDLYTSLSFSNHRRGVPGTSPTDESCEWREPDGAAACAGRRVLQVGRRFRDPIYSIRGKAMIRWKRMAQENGGSGGNANETRRQHKRAELVGSETCGDVTWSGNGPIVVVVRMPTFQQYAYCPQRNNPIVSNTTSI